MRKKARMLSFALWGLLFGMALTGCAGTEFLSDIPRDFVLPQKTGEPKESMDRMAEANEPTVLALAAMDRLSFLMEEAYHFAGDSLSETEQLWYQNMEQTLGSYGTDVELDPKGLEAGLSEEDIDKIFQCVMCDHPELFYVDGYSYTKYMRGEEVTSITFSGTYNVDLETAVEREQEIRATAEEILTGIGKEAGDYDKVKYVYDTLISTTDYDMEIADNQNIYSVFVHHLSVCQGYAKATQYLLNRLGVECTLVQGAVLTGEGHAWNLVKVDGDYYYIDTTWGDVSYQMEDADPENSGGNTEGQAEADLETGDKNAGEQEDADSETDNGSISEQPDANPKAGKHDIDWEDMPEINYDYLNVTTQDILQTHTIGSVVPMPLCTAVEANYYKREGALFTCYDREQMEILFQKTFETGKQDVTIKCQDAACYEEIYEALITEKEIFSYLKEGKSTVAYAQNENQFSLTFWVTNE